MKTLRRRRKQENQKEEENRVTKTLKEEANELKKEIDQKI